LRDSHTVARLFANAFFLFSFFFSTGHFGVGWMDGWIGEALLKEKTSSLGILNLAFYRLGE